ncbi:hypothetical protein QT236_17945 (plasmid) [Geobacillus stearothermophilus]|nr:hypothetical protein QT236_17945 [Geobacillus stearothermophilus]
MVWFGHLYHTGKFAFFVPSIFFIFLLSSMSIYQVQLVVKSRENNIIIPFSSVTGPGGRASIVAGDSGRIVYWSVKPATAWPYNFVGLVKLRYYSGFKRDVPVGGMGALGSTVSGAVTMNKNNGGVAYLSGTAYALTGDRYRVLPGVSTTFRPN